MADLVKVERGALAGVTHVFLDVGGTMLYEEPSAADLFHRILTARGHLPDRDRLAYLLHTPGTILSLIRPFPHGREGEFFRAMNSRVIEHLEIDPEDAILDEIHAEFSKAVEWRLFPDTLQTVRDLRDAGYRLGVISNASHNLPEKLRTVGLAEYFDTVTYSFDVGAEKPDVRIFRRAVAQADATEENCVHVGNSYEADYLGARRAGLHAVLLQRKGQPPAPCPWIRSLEALRDILMPPRSRP